MAEINRDDWLAALSDVMGPPEDPDALTRAELSEMFGMERSAITKRIQLLVADGRLVQTWKRVVNCRGLAARVPAYKLVKPEAKGKKR